MQPFKIKSSKTIAVERLKAMKVCLQAIQKHQPTMRAWAGERFLCTLVSRYGCDKRAITDTKCLIDRALQGEFTLEAWFMIANNRPMTNEEALDLRIQWVKQLIRDCNKEIKRLS